jgi:dihydroorotase
VVDQGGASPLTFLGFRKFVAQASVSRVFSFISIYLAGGLYGHRHTGLYGPHGIDVNATVKAIEENRDIVKGIKAHAELGGYSRWGLEVLKLAKEASRRANVPVYIHTGRLWPEAKDTVIDPDSVVPEALPYLDAGDVLAHPFTRHAGAFVSKDGHVHPLVLEAIKRGVRIDVGRGSHFSFEKARIVLDAGIVPFTLGADLHGSVPRHPNASAFTHSLYQAMSEMLALGVSLHDVIRTVTCNAATFLGLEGEVGTLAVGAPADISIVALQTGEWTLRDNAGIEVNATHRFQPVAALRAGVTYPVSSPLLPELMAAAA